MKGLFGQIQRLPFYSLKSQSEFPLGPFNFVWKFKNSAMLHSIFYM